MKIRQITFPGAIRDRMNGRRKQYVLFSYQTLVTTVLNALWWRHER